MSTVEVTTSAPVEQPITGSDAGSATLGARRFAGLSSVDSRWLDWGERVSVLILYGWLVSKILLDYSAQGGLANLLLLPSEGLVVLFLLLRRHTREISRSFPEWVVAMVATCAPLLVSPVSKATRDQIPSAVVAIAATVLLVGMLLQVHAKITLGRSFGCVPANRGLKVVGPYRFVRHPMYAGYLLSHSAFLAMNPTAWNVAIYALSYATQVPRLLAEERLLSRDPGYREYSAVVRYRLIPGLF